MENLKILLSDTEPLSQPTDIDYLKQLQYGLQKGLASGSLSDEVRFSGMDIANEVMDKLNNYIVDSEKAISAA